MKLSGDSIAEQCWRRHVGASLTGNQCTNIHHVSCWAYTLGTDCMWILHLLGMQAGQPWQMDPYTLKTHPGPDNLGDFLAADSAPTNPLASLWAQAAGNGKADGQGPSTALGKPMGKGRSDRQSKGKPAQPGKACTAHPHVVHGEGMSDRLAVYSSNV